MVVIIGAGLAGLTCARVLHEAGLPVTVLESTHAPGGRLRTDRHPDGYLLDRGFQVLFTAYPTARRRLSYPDLQLRAFAPGALIARSGKVQAVADPLRAPGYLPATLASSSFSLGDRLRVARLALKVRRTSLMQIFAEPDCSTLVYLQRRGFSDRCLERFFRPFYGGIFLDRSLATSSAMFLFTFKMLSEGLAVVPRLGMQAVPEQLAAALPVGAVRCQAPVQALLRQNGRARGVCLADGEEVAADAVVVATDSLAAADLLDDRSLRRQPVGSVCVYFASPISLYSDRLIVLNARRDAYINNLQQITNVAPEYAPVGQHLLSLTLLRVGGDSDEEIERHCRQELALLFPHVRLDGLRLLRIYRLPRSQFAQPPGTFGRLPGHTTALSNVFLASEITASSSIEGAMASGEGAAQAVLAAAKRGSSHA